MKKLFTLFLLALLPSMASAIVERTINVSKAGTLSSYISESEKYKIEKLTLTGKINGDDLRLLREMAGGEIYPKEGKFSSTVGALSVLDMSAVKIVAGGVYMYEWDSDLGWDGKESIDNSIWWAFWGCRVLTSITIPNSVTSIGPYAFQDCSGLTSITIPNSVTSIWNSAFNGCSGLMNMVVEGGNPKYDSRDNCNAIIETATNTLIAGCKESVIPNSVTSIGNSAFAYCSGLTSVTIGNSVTSIGSSAFSNCSGLTSVTIGNSVTSIGESAFYGCSGLMDFYCYAIDVPTTNWSFGNTENVTLHVPASSIDAYKEASPWNEFKEIVAIDETSEDEIKITSAGQTTWCSAFDLDFTDVEGLKAYTAEGYDRETGTIWLMRVKKVPAGEGILLIGDEGVYKVPHKATTCYYGNFMVGTLSAKTINETDGEYTNYYLSNGTYGIGFYRVNGTQSIGANRAYLPLLKNTVSSTRGFIGIDFDDDAEGTTGIHSIENGKMNIENDVYYNLQGQRVDNPSKGLYIRNGKKVVIK